jgi:hypothetical protein
MSSAIDEATIAARQPVLVDLALQGGGSHGAFTWGCARPAARRAVDQNRGDLGNLRRSHECGGVGGWMVNGRRRWCAGRT